MLGGSELLQNPAGELGVQTTDIPKSEAIPYYRPLKQAEAMSRRRGSNDRPAC